MLTFDEINLNIGRILTNLLELELALRTLLEATQRRSGLVTSPPVSVSSLSVGDLVPETPLSNYDTLSQLIKKVNVEIEKHGLPDRIDVSISCIRDILAHGRLSASYPEGPFSLLKFAKPINHLAEITMRVYVTSEWFSEQINNTSIQLYKAIEVGQKLGLKCFPDRFANSKQT